MNKTAVLFRPSLAEEGEYEVAQKHFHTVPNRTRIPEGSLVVGRYSVLPYYQELVDDLAVSDSKLINSYRQHRYVADISSYMHTLYGLTPKTWGFHDLGSIPEGIPLVLKGETNSMKYQWNSHMFAKDKKAAIEVYRNLSRDNLVGQQTIYVREYVPLVRLLEDTIGPPVTLEFRFFVAYGKILSSGYYWSSHVDQLETVPDPSMVPQEFLDKVINLVKDKVNFFVMDVAKTESGDWIVIELNDGQMSGLSENKSEVLYKNLSNVLATRPWLDV